MDTRENIEAIEEAVRLIEEAQSLVDGAVRGTTQEGHYNAYGRYGFDQLLGNGNPNDSGLHDLIRKL